MISLSPEAQHHAVELTRTMACEVEFWPSFDPTVVEGSREEILAAYRALRDTLWQRIRERFPRRPDGTGVADFRAEPLERLKRLDPDAFR